jgi:hypothetical protein
VYSCTGRRKIWLGGLRELLFAYNRKKVANVLKQNQECLCSWRIGSRDECEMTGGAQRLSKGFLNFLPQKEEKAILELKL